MNNKKLLFPNKIYPDHERNLIYLQKCIDSKEFVEAIAFASTKVDKYPDILGYKKTLAFCFYMLGDLEKSKALWLNLINLDPYSEETLLNLADIEKKFNNLDSSYGLIKLATEYWPQSYKPWMSMAELCLLKKDYQASLIASLEAIKIDPAKSDAYQNLGSSFFHLAKFDEAKHSFETALLLNPSTKEAKHSLGLVLFKQEKTHEALDIMMELIATSLPSDRLSLDQIKWDTSLILLRLGNLAKGWEYYEFGLSTKVFGNLSRHPFRSFNVESWSPKFDNNLPVLVWREQGIGDEILFMTCLNDMIKYCSQIIVECDKRLINLFKRSFPNIIFREPKFNQNPPHDAFESDFSSHIAMGSLMNQFRSNIDFFPDSGGYLKPDSLLEKKWCQRIGQINYRKIRVGISWRSGILDPLRNAKYSTLSDWGVLLNPEYFEIFNLQFGDTHDEINDAENKFSIKINCWNDLDLKNDLDDVFALINNLDHVVTISSAVWTFSAALGIPTTLLLRSNHWAMFDQEFIPFFPNVICRVANTDQQIQDLLPTVVDDLLGNKKTRT